LGEMLALSDTKKLVRSDDKDGNEEQEPRESISCLTNKLNKEESLVDSPKNLLRSKSVPVSSTVNGARLSIEVSDPEAGKTHVPKELTKAKSTKSSFKGKVSSLFFSRNKKSSKDKSAASQSKDESLSASSETPGSPLHFLGVNSDATTQCINDGSLCPSPHGSSGKTSPDLTSMGQNQGTATCEVVYDLFFFFFCSCVFRCILDLMVVTYSNIHPPLRPKKRRRVFSTIAPPRFLKLAGLSTTVF
jgi:hypothetical protein